MRSKHPGDILEWLRKIIESCETPDQAYTAWKCISNFKNTYNLPLEYKWKADTLVSALNSKHPTFLLQIRN
jgi:hypothetical protein